MKVKYTKLTDTLFLSVFGRPNGKTPATSSGKTNDILILDLSGSMTWTIDKLCEDAKARVRQFKQGDTLTLGWFSGEGDFRFELIGYALGSEADYKTVDAVLNRMKRTRNTTCFSEILGDVKNVIASLSAGSKRFALYFLTDGHPVVSNYQREIEGINRAIDGIKNSITTTMFVGYGNYYNRELLTTMATRIGGTLVHSNQPDEAAETMARFVSESADAEPRIEVDVPVSNPMAVFTVSGSRVNVYNVEKGKVLVSLGKGEGTVFALTDNPSGEVVYLNDKDALRGAYAAAWVLSQTAQADKALEVLSAIGDVALVEALSNAFTNDEFGAAEKKIAKAASSESARFVRGRKSGIIPAYDAPCLLDALEALAADPDAAFLPRHPAFHYTAITRKRVTKGDYPEFVAGDTVRVPFSTLTWNDNKLNLSVLARIPGTVTLRGDYAQHNLPEVFKTAIFRNYAFVKDGAVSILKPVPVVLGPESFNALRDMGIILAHETYTDNDHVYLADFTAVPVINRKMADEMRSARAMFNLAWKEVVLQGKIKALNSLRKELDPDKEVTKSGYPPETEAYLNTQGIKNGVYSPDSEEVEATDFYYAKTVAIKVAGYSSLPALKAVREKTSKGKDLTPAEKLVADGVSLFEANAPKNGGPKVQVKWIDVETEALKAELRDIRSELQRGKFALLLAHRWPEEFKSRSENELEIDGRKFKIELGEEKIEI